MDSEFLRAVAAGDLPKVQRLLREGVGSVTEVDDHGHTALWLAVLFYQWPTAQWLLEYGGADPSTTWDMFGIKFNDLDDNAAVIAILRVMLLRGDPTASFSSRFSPETARLIQEGTQLRTRLPAYLVQRRALLDEHCPLIAPLRALVSGYEVPTTTEELWDTGLGAAP